ncbi:MAG: hypothetical protein DI630_16455 [Gordonia sp. (in: high G+C Gram-positive bacteria)]|nr:MAG: hypothetical protein DI630_16455 [Gordonia sp. (in: high G+C Gram-positive bacteria)]
MAGVAAGRFVKAPPGDGRQEALELGDRATGVTSAVVQLRQGHRRGRSYCVAGHLGTPLGGVAHLAQQGLVLAPLLVVLQALYLAPPGREVLPTDSLRGLSRLKRVNVIVVHGTTVDG